MSAPSPSWPAPVVVGVDGSDSSRHAVVLATRLAARRQRPLRVVHAFIWPLLRVPLGPSAEGPADGGLAHDADAIVAEAVTWARDTGLPVRVSGGVEVGAPARVMLTESDRAAMVVLGDRGLGGFASLLLGSVAIQVAAHASCPVVIARGATGAVPAPDPDADGRGVLVGVDGSAASTDALAFAAEEANLRGVAVTALHAYTYPTSLGPGDVLPLVYDPAAFAAEERDLLDRAVTAARGRYPRVAIDPLLVAGEPRRALLDAAASAALVVVGTRGRGELAGLVLGSVSHALLHHAPCPVAILR